MAGLGHGFQNYTHLKIFSRVHNGQEEEEEAKVRREKEKKGEERRGETTRGKEKKEHR